MTNVEAGTGAGDPEVLAAGRIITSGSGSGPPRTITTAATVKKATANSNQRARAGASGQALPPKDRPSGDQGERVGPIAN
ncbi:MAG: hypothetical protein ACRDRT_08215 [Pseudonocardiaceae bacterium]